MKTFYLPDLGEGLHDATILEWYAVVGAELAQGEPLLAVETAKAVVEIPAPEPLRISAIWAAINSVINVGMPLLDYQPLAEDTVAASTTATPIPPLVDRSSVSVVGRLAEASTTQPQTDRPFILGRNRFSEAEIARGQQALQAQRPVHAPTISPSTTAADNVPLSGHRLSMSRQLSSAHQQVALVTLMDEVAVRWPTNTRPLPRLVRALCAGCAAEPLLNRGFDQQQLIAHTQVNIGIAIDTPHGLLVPVLHNAETLDLYQIDNQINALRTQALAQQLSPAQLQGATISLSNFGMLAGRFATAMVVPPQVAILAVGQIRQDQRLTKKGRLKSVLQIPLSLSFDHRVLTGGEAARFLAAVMADLALKL